MNTPHKKTAIDLVFNFIKNCKTKNTNELNYLQIQWLSKTSGNRLNPTELNLRHEVLNIYTTSILNTAENTKNTKKRNMTDISEELYPPIKTQQNNETTLQNSNISNISNIRVI